MAGERSGLFFEIVRVAQEIQPKFLFLENVPAITSRGGLQVVREIAQMGYDCRWCVISAASVGALHKRERWFLLAYSQRQRLQGRENSGQTKIPEFRNGSLSIPHARLFDERKPKESKRTSVHPSGQDGFWEVEPDVGKLADGVSYRVDKLKCIGNAVVPRQAKKSFEILMGIGGG